MTTPASANTRPRTKTRVTHCAEKQKSDHRDEDGGQIGEQRCVGHRRHGDGEMPGGKIHGEDDARQDQHAHSPTASRGFGPASLPLASEKRKIGIKASATRQKAVAIGPTSDSRTKIGEPPDRRTAQNEGGQAQIGWPWRVR